MPSAKALTIFILIFTGLKAGASTQKPDSGAVLCSYCLSATLFVFSADEIDEKLVDAAIGG